jgi:chemotaxis protein CheZ
MPDAEGDPRDGHAGDRVFQQIGTITRLLHDTMQQLGVMPKLQIAADGLPDARSRLNYIANKTAEPPNKVLNSVDQAKAEHAAIARPRASWRRPSWPTRCGRGQRRGVELRAGRRAAHTGHRRPPDRHHDGAGLPRPHRPGGGQGGDAGQRPGRQPGQAAGAGGAAEQREKVDPKCCNGPVVNPEGRTDVVANQGEVDDLLASLGF